MTASFVAAVREPLVQFLGIGALLFAVDRAVTLQRDDPYQIIVGENELSRLVQVFTEGQGRPPVETEVDALVGKWAQNEIFYREAQAMGLDQGDDMMRSRLILKMRNVIFNRVIPETPQEDELRQWFELNREAYDTPRRYSVERLVLPAAETAAEAEAMAAGLAHQDPPETLGAPVRRYLRRSVENIEALISAEAAARLLQAAVGQWIAAGVGEQWNLLRVTEITPAIPADYERVKSRVVEDFRKAASGLQVSRMAEAIAAKYDIHVEYDEADLRQLLANAADHEPAPVTAQSRSARARAGVAKAEEG
jgi:hypothetical protein